MIKGPKFPGITRLRKVGIANVIKKSGANGLPSRTGAEAREQLSQKNEYIYKELVFFSLILMRGR